MALLILLILILTQAVAEAQDLPPFKLGLSTQIVAAGFDLIPKPPGLTGNKLSYRPAQSNYAGVILGYRWVAGTVSFAVPANAQIRAAEGISKYRDYRLSYYSKQFGVEVSYTRYLGFLIDNSSVLSAAALSGQTYYKIPDLETLGYGATFICVHSPEVFSLPAAIDQSDIQSKSAGSWIYVGALRQQNFTSNAPVIPTEKKVNFGADQDLNAAFATTLAAGAGYAYNYVLGSFYTSALAALSLGYQHVHYQLTGTDPSTTTVAPNIHARIGFGFNAIKFFTTASIYIDYFVHDTQTIQVNNSIYGITLAGGLRF